MDELSGLLEDSSLISRAKKTIKRKSCPSPVLSSVKRRGRPPKQAMSCTDEGIGDSLDPLNESIADSVKRRKRVTNSRQFDSKYFFDSVVDRMEYKYKNKPKNDAIIDLENMEILDRKGFVEQRVRTEFGYFAENTLEDLRTNSFRNKELISCPLIASTPEPNRKPTKGKQQSVGKQCNQRGAIPSTSRALQLRTKLAIQPLKKSLTNIMIASDVESDDEMIISPSQLSDNESIVSNQSEELDENHPLMKYENKNLWTDKDYQIVCFKKIMELLKNDRSDRFKEALKQRAQQTINLPALPSGPNVVPIIRFNLKGEPNFEFHFLSKDSPLEPRDALKMDNEIICLSKTIYEWITLKSNPKRAPKRLSYNKRQLEFI